MIFLCCCLSTSNRRLNYCLENNNFQKPSFSNSRRCDQLNLGHERYFGTAVLSYLSAHMHAAREQREAYIQFMVLCQPGVFWMFLQFLHDEDHFRALVWYVFVLIANGHVDTCDYFQPKLVLFENVSIIFMVVKKTKHNCALLDFCTLRR